MDYGLLAQVVHSSLISNDERSYLSWASRCAIIILNNLWLVLPVSGVHDYIK